MNTEESWPAGQTWGFQGTVAEDATGGTHVCSLTVTPGAGNEMQVLYGQITVGATATAQTAQVAIDDGTNTLSFLVNPEGLSETTTGGVYIFPSSGQVGNPLVSNIDYLVGIPTIVSGTMRLRLLVTTTAVSVTQTFAVVCRLKGTLPTATLADTVGGPVLTTNTNRVF